MYSEATIRELNRLNFEDIVWIIYATSTISNVYGNYLSLFNQSVAPTINSIEKL